MGEVNIHRPHRWPVVVGAIGVLVILLVAVVLGFRAGSSSGPSRHERTCTEQAAQLKDDVVRVTNAGEAGDRRAQARAYRRLFRDVNAADPSCRMP